MSEKKLLRCPFCGGEARLQKKNRKRGWYVICKNRSCACSTPFYQNTFTSEENLKRVAIDTWNTRKAMERIVERLENHIRYCELCHEEFKDSRMSLTYEVQLNSYKNAIKIVKEEGGIDGKNL